VHCAIALLLIANLSGSELEKHAVDICGHINTVGLAAYCTDDQPDSTVDGQPNSSAADLVATAGDCWLRFFAQSGMVECVIALEKSAGRQAKSASAYDSAIGFFSVALHLVQRRDSLAQRERASPGDLTLHPPSSDDSSAFPRVSSSCWSSSHASCLRLYKELCDCLFLSASFADAVRCIEYVLSNVTELIERADFFEVCTSQRRLNAPMRSCLCTRQRCCAHILCICGSSGCGHVSVLFLTASFAVSQSAATNVRLNCARFGASVRAGHSTAGVDAAGAGGVVQLRRPERRIHLSQSPSPASTTHERPARSRAHEGDERNGEQTTTTASGEMAETLPC